MPAHRLFPYSPLFWEKNLQISLHRQVVATEAWRFQDSVRCFAAAVAPKSKSKKSQAESTGGDKNAPPAAEGSNHRFNIFSGLPDHKILDDSQYPDWLWELSKPAKSYGELSLMFIYGKGIESATFPDYARFRKLHNRFTIKLNNMRLTKGRGNSIFNDI